MIHACGPAVRPSARSAAAGVEDPLDFPPSGSPSCPVLTAGTHLSPDDGACLMELVSVLAGHRWSDRPACTDATLATIARVVNDELSHPVRQHLAPLAATLVGHLGVRARMAPALVERCLAAAQQHLPTAPPALDRHRRRAARRLAATHRPRSGRLRAAALAWLYERGPAQHAISAMAVALRRLPRSERDAALWAVLGTALDLRYVSQPR